MALLIVLSNAKSLVKHAFARIFWLLAILLISFAGSTSALDPTSHISEYGHSVWRVQDGYFGGMPSAIAQTTDGYIWVGTDAGLFKFDGVRFAHWNGSPGNELPSSISALLGARDGSLWIGTDTGLAHLANNRLTMYEKGWAIGHIIMESKDGKIWFSRHRTDDRRRPLCQAVGNDVHCYGEEDGIALTGPRAIAQDDSGDLWIGSEKTLVRWRVGALPKVYRPQALRSNDGYGSVNAITRAGDGSIWVGSDLHGPGGGLQHLIDGALKPFRAPSLDGEDLAVSSLFSDDHRNLWVGTYHGLYKISGKDVDHYGAAEGLSDDIVYDIFEDRERNVWLATSQGVDMFRDLRVTSISAHEGLSEDAVESVAAGADGQVWIGTSRLQVLEPKRLSLHAIKALKGDQVTSLLVDHAGRLWTGMNNKLFVRQQRAFREITKSDGSPLGMIMGIAEDSDRNIWVETSGPPGTLVRIHDLKVQEMFPEPEVPLARKIVADPNRGIWLGLVTGDLARFRDGQLQVFNFGEHPNSRVLAITAVSDGSIFGGTSFGVVAWKNGKHRILSVRNGLPCNDVSGLISDDAGNLWLFTQCGLVEIPSQQMQAWWKQPDRKLSLRVFDALDGFRAGLGHFNTSAKTPDGRLWFATGGVLQVIDPAHVPRNNVPPPVQISAVLADHKAYPADSGVKLPALTRDLEIDYTALSYAAPQKVLFGYMLEGRDSGFQEAGTRRQAFYNDLRPGSYRFHVMACNSDGVWSEVGASLYFSVLPAYYQTGWFRVLCLALLLASLWAAYRLRVRRLQKQERKLRDVIETMPALAFIAKPDGQRTFVNGRWVEYTGLTEEQGLGWGWQAAVHPDDLSQVVGEWQKSTAALEYEARLRCGKDGVYRWFQTRAVPVHDKRGKIVKWYGVINDIEDRKRAEELQRELAHVNRVNTMGELTASLAHEIKQPIGAALTNADACVRFIDRDQPDLSEAQAAALEMAKDARRAADIIDRVRLLYQKGSPQREVVQVNDVIEEMVLMLQSEVKRHSITIHTELAEGLPTVIADRVQLQQALMNLMLNAIEAIGDKSGELSVTSQVGEDDQLRISVTDTGEGLLPENINKVFNAFFTTKRQGTGLGLAITRSIVESHGGRIWATANTGRGATFHFTLPSRRAAAA